MHLLALQTNPQIWAELLSRTSARGGVGN